MGTKDRQSPAKKKHVTAVATAVALGGGIVVGWFLRGGAEAKSRDQEQSDATIAGVQTDDEAQAESASDQPGNKIQAEIAGVHTDDEAQAENAGDQPGNKIQAEIAGVQTDDEAQAENASDQPGHKIQAEIAGVQTDDEAQAENAGDQTEPPEKPRGMDHLQVIGRVALVALLLIKAGQILCSAFAGWTWGDTSADQATAAAIALFAVQFSATALNIHRRWAWILCDFASAGLALASLYSLVPETGIGNTFSALFALLAIVPFAVVRCAEYLGATESVPVWDYYSTTWRAEQMRAEHARLARLDDDRKAFWGRRRKAIREALSGLRGRLLRRPRRGGSSKP